MKVGAPLAPTSVNQPLPAPEPQREPLELQPLPAGWERLETDDGACYYHHQETGETTWELPERRV